MNKPTARLFPAPLSDPTEWDSYRRLLRFVQVRLGRGDGAQDLVQDAYVRLARTAERSEIGNPEGFLHVAAGNLVRDRARAIRVRNGRALAAVEDAAAVPCPQPGAERALIACEQLKIVENALAELPMKRRAAVVLHRIDGLSQREVAERLGISVSMVEKHIRLGIEHCRHRLTEAEASL